MIRTQIYLPEEMYHELKQQAAREARSLAELIRQRIALKKKKVTRQNHGIDVLAALAKRAKETRHIKWKAKTFDVDRLLYGPESLDFGDLYKKR